MCIYSYRFKPQSPSKYSPFDAIHLLRLFSTAQNSFWTRQFWCLSVLPPFLISPLPHRQNVPFGDFFHLGKQTKKIVIWSKIGWIGRVGVGQCSFLVKNCWTLSTVWAGVLINHPSRNGQTCWESSEKVTEAKRSLSQQCQLVHWHRWVPRTLT